MPRTGRPPVLDETKRREIVAMLSVGCSRRAAAQYVGCAPGTLTQTALRDPHFADQLNRAQMRFELGALHRIQQASHRSWQANAWLLERVLAFRYARRGPHVVTGHDHARALDDLCDRLMEDIPPSRRVRAHHRVAARLAELEGREPCEVGVAHRSRASQKPAHSPREATSRFGEGLPTPPHPPTAGLHDGPRDQGTDVPRSPRAGPGPILGLLLAALLGAAATLAAPSLFAALRATPALVADLTPAWLGSSRSLRSDAPSDLRSARVPGVVAQSAQHRPPARSAPIHWGTSSRSRARRRSTRVSRPRRRAAAPRS
jgi:hypothetical protein